MNGTSNSANDKNELFHMILFNEYFFNSHDKSYEAFLIFKKTPPIYRKSTPRDGWSLLSLTNLIE